MFSQSSSRNQRPKGLKVKHAFQITLLLVVSIWLLYQVTHSHNKPKGYNGEKKLSSEHRSMVLGRKGDLGSSEGVDTDSSKVNHATEDERKEDGGGGDDELDRNFGDRVQQESLVNGHKDLQEKFTNGEKEEMKEFGTQDRESVSSEDNILGAHVRDGKEFLNKGHEDSKEGLTNNVEHNDREKSERKNEEPDNREEGNAGVEIIDKDEAVGSGNVAEEPLNKRKDDSKESFTDHVDQEDRGKLERENVEPKNGEKENLDNTLMERVEAVGSGKDPSGNAEDISQQHNEIKNISVPDQSEMGDVLQGFHDENGIPPGGHDLLNTHRTTSEEQAKATNGDHETILTLENPTQHEDITVKTASESSNSSQADEQTDRGRSTDNLLTKHGNVKSQESDASAEVENKSSRTLEGNKIKSNNRDEQANATNWDHGTTSSLESRTQHEETTTQTSSESSNLSQADERTDRRSSTENLLSEQGEVKYQESETSARVETESNRPLESNITGSNDTDEQAKATDWNHKTISRLENLTQHEEIMIQAASESPNSSQDDEQADRRSTDNLLSKQGEVKSQENDTSAEVETLSYRTVESNKTETNDDAQNSPQSGDNPVASSIRGSSESTEVAIVISSESPSSFQPQNEEAIIIKTLPPTENAADCEE